jgi:hypothetical protein
MCQGWQYPGPEDFPPKRPSAALDTTWGIGRQSILPYPSTRAWAAGFGSGSAMTSWGVSSGMILFLRTLLLCTLAIIPLLSVPDGAAASEQSDKEKASDKSSSRLPQCRATSASF